MKLSDITDLITVTAAYPGYAPTGTKLPYVAARPLLVDPEEDIAITGDGIAWDYQFSLYCCAGSVEAAFNLAVAVMADLQGARVGGSTLSCSMGYDGALVEGHYESQVTVQINQGALA